MRHKIGTDLLWLTGATAVVFDGQTVLLVKRADSGQWSPVTGIVDPGEHPAQTATREVLEETGVDCVAEELVWVNVTAPMTYPNGDEVQYLDHTFRCRYLAGTAHPADDESSEAGWFALDNLPPMDAKQVERILTARDHAGPTRLR